MVGNETGYVNSKTDKILKFVDSLGLAEVLNSKVEINSFSVDYMKDAMVSDYDGL